MIQGYITSKFMSKIIKILCGSFISIAMLIIFLLTFILCFLNLMYIGGTVSSLGDNPITPIEGNNIQMTAGYGYYDPWGTGSMSKHGGVDFVASESNPPIMSILDGTITNITTGCVVGDTSCGGGYGNHVVIESEWLGKTYSFYYAHFQTVYPNLQVGDYVKMYQPIGVMGMTGNATGVHLHFEQRYQGVSQDPLTFLTKYNALMQENLQYYIDKKNEGIFKERDVYFENNYVIELFNYKLNN